MPNVKDCPGFKSFGADVQQAREAVGMSRRELAERVGIDPRYLANIELCGTIPSVPVVMQLIRLCKLPAERYFNPGLIREDSEQRQRTSHKLQLCPEKYLPIVEGVIDGAIKLNEIKQRVLPELNDEFVKKVSKFQTVDELKADIKDYIDMQRKNIKKVNAENAIFKTIIDSTTVEIPRSMIDREAASLKEEYKQRMAYQGLDWNSFVASQGDDFDSNIDADASARIKNSLIIDKISKEVDIKVDQADFQSKLSQMASLYGVGANEIVKQFGQNPDFLSSITQQIINEKVRDYLFENNNVEYVEVKPKESAVEV